MEEILWSKPKDMRRAEELIRELGLHRKKNMPVTSLSWGEKQKLALATIILNNPKVLILDEPTHGQDLFGLLQLEKILSELKQGGSSILLITHDNEVAEAFGDLTFEIKEGKLYGKR